jgi:hypothetical protein
MIYTDTGFTHHIYIQLLTLTCTIRTWINKCQYTKDPQWYPFNKGNNLHSGTFQYWNVLAHGLPIPWALHIYSRKLLKAHHVNKSSLLHWVMAYCHGITVLVIWICLKPQRHFSNMYLKRTFKAWRKICTGITQLIIDWQNLFTEF